MWEKSLLKSKFKATAVHMALGLLIFLPIAWLIVFRWYPGPFFYTDGGWQGLRIILLVDMVLGPVLTFLVFNPSKSRVALGVDFSFIALVQAAALVYGVYSVQSTSIWAVAFNNAGLYERSFVGVGKNQFLKQQIPEGGWDRFGQGPQYWVYVRPPQVEDTPRLIEEAKRELSADSLYDFYEPLAAHRDDMLSKALDMQALTAKDEDLAEHHRRFVEKHADASGGLHFFRMLGFYRSVIIALDGEGRYVGFINRDLIRGSNSKK